MFKNDFSFLLNMYIGVAGNIGVGKSTLAKIISSRLDCTLVEESVVDNPYLTDFYADKKRWAFETQIFFVTDRLVKLRNDLSHPNVVLDRTIYEDNHIFAKNLLAEDSIDQRAYDTYKKFYDYAIHNLPVPDLLIYLKADVPKLKNNIQKRGRSNEQQLADSADTYIAQLNTLYDGWIANYDLGKVMTIDFNDLDVLKKEDENIVIEQIKNNLLY